MIKHLTYDLKQVD